MALSLPIVIPSPAASSSASTDDSAPPRTPISPSMASSAPPASSNNPASASNDGGLKRKPSRRANTAERRATHNAVERQRRETLNGRFLDLAALLPNLQQIRRPSKSSIVNSSIAHIHASRRHRVLASRELRLLKVEADALRRELNEWRDRAGIPRVEEPVRGEGFAVVLGGELEVLVVNGVGEEGDDDAEFGPYPSMDGQGLYEMGEEEEMVARQQHEQAAAAAQAQVLHMARLQAQAPPPSNPPSRRPTISLPSGPSIPPPSATTPHGHAMTPSGGMLGGHGPMIASPTQMQFDGHNPVLGTHAHSPHGHSPMHGHGHQDMFSGQPIETDKLSAWNMYTHGQQQHYANQQQQIIAQQQQQQQYMIQQQQQYHPQMMQGGIQIKRERSSSIGSRSSTSSGSGSVSPHHVGGGSPPQHFDGGMGFEAQWMMGGGITKGGMVV